MKIKLKLKRKHLVIIHEALSLVEFPGLLSKEERIRKSIFQQVYLKVAKKSLEAQVNPNDKPVTISFLYHEACELEKRLQEHVHFSKGSYEANAIRILIDQLNQKLA